MNRLFVFIKSNWIVMFSILYILSPIDLIPEAFVPVLGLVDDLGVAGIAGLKVYSDHKKSKVIK